MTKEPDKIEEQGDDAPEGKFNRGRRKFLAHSGVYTASLMGTALLGACGGDDDEAFAKNPDDNGGQNPGPTDAQILNFALNLEYLEAEFYLRAIGSTLENEGIMIDGQGSVGPVNGGRQVPFQTGSIRQYAREIAKDEADHVRFLRFAVDAAGFQPVARPKIDISAQGVFTGLARAAGVVGPNQIFDPYANEINFLLAAYVFEDVGVTAYKGASPFVTSPLYLEAAAGILAAEAYHAGLIRTELYDLGLQTPSIYDTTTKISNLRDAVGGVDNRGPNGAVPSLDQGADRDQGIVAVDDMGNVKTDGFGTPIANIVPLDQKGKAYSRFATDVLNVVYGTPKQTTDPSMLNPVPPAFFPIGVNGAINKSSDNTGAPPA